MNKKVVRTKDGSDTISVEELGVSYHSIHGALQESIHVFINAGLDGYIKANAVKPVRVFEMGLGTGLNACLTCLYTDKNQVSVNYHAVEMFPLEIGQIRELNYKEQLSDDEDVLEQLHSCDWNKPNAITKSFTFTKYNTALQDINIKEQFDVIYYDAFAPNAQPELWTVDIFKKLFGVMSDGGILVTYCSKGDVRRAMLEVGFKVEKLQGPPGKREMLRAIKRTLD